MWYWETGSRARSAQRRRPSQLASSGRPNCRAHTVYISTVFIITYRGTVRLQLGCKAGAGARGGGGGVRWPGAFSILFPFKFQDRQEAVSEHRGSVEWLPASRASRPTDSDRHQSGAGGWRAKLPLRAHPAHPSSLLAVCPHLHPDLAHLAFRTSLCHRRTHRARWLVRVVPHAVRCHVARPSACHVARPSACHVARPSACRDACRDACRAREPACTCAEAAPHPSSQHVDREGVRQQRLGDVGVHRPHRRHEARLPRRAAANPAQHAR